MRIPAALLPCLLATLPAAVLAQTAGAIAVSETSDTADGGRSEGLINISECSGTNPVTGASVFDSSLNLAWTLSQTPAATSVYRVYATTLTTCPTTCWPTTSASLRLLTSTSQPTSGLATGQMGPVLARAGVIAGTDADTCSPADAVYLCVVVCDSLETTIQDAKAGPTTLLDLVKPPAPTGVGASPGDYALTVSWTAGTGSTAVATTYTVSAIPDDPTDPAGSCTTSGAASTSCRIGGLAAYKDYTVSVRGFSDSLNASDPAVAGPFQPVQVDDFWRYYRDNGGREKGGCGQGAGLLALLGLLPFAWRQARRRP